MVLGVSDGHVYFAERLADRPCERWAVKSVPAEGGKPRMIAEVDGELAPDALAGTDFYFVGAEKLQHLSLSTSRLTVLAPTLPTHGDGAVVVDRQCVYWTQARVELGAKGE
jgi:hypothetical protein